MRRIALWTVLIALIGANVVGAQVYVSMPDIVADQGEEVLYPITISNVSGLNLISYQIELRYDSDVITAMGVSTDNSISEAWENLFYNKDIQDELSIAAFDTNPLEGEGVLLYINFLVIGVPAAVSEIAFEFVELSGDTTNIVEQNGRIKVRSNLVEVVVGTDVPVGSNVIVDGVRYDAPYRTEWIRGSNHTIRAVDDVTTQDGVRYLFSLWSDGKPQMHVVSTQVDTSFTAYYTMQYYLQLESAYGEPSGEGWYDVGAVASFSVQEEVSATEDTKYRFDGWQSASANGYNGKLRNATVVMTNPITEYVIWKPVYRVDIRSDYGTTRGSGWYESGAIVRCGIDTLVIQGEDARYQFKRWDGIGVGSYSGSEPMFNLIVNNPIIEQALWDEWYYIGFVSEPEGLLPLSGSNWYVAGAEVTSDTAPDTVIEGRIVYHFKGWRLHGQTLDGNPVTVKADSGMQIVASYGYPISVMVTTNIGEGSTVIVDGEEHEAPYEAQWMAYDEHIIDVPDYQGINGGQRFAFTAWNIGGTQEQIVRPLTNKTYIAVLRTQYYLRVSTVPEDLFNLQGTDWYDAGHTISLNPAPTLGRLNGQDFRFRYWTVNNDVAYGNPISINVNQPKEALAYYDSCYSIFGTVLLDGAGFKDVQVVLTGLGSDTVYSKSNGEFKFSALFRGNYTISPKLEGYSFDPASRDIRDLSANIGQQDFIANVMAGAGRLSSEPVTETFTLFQNYPNPFNNSTVISFLVPGTGHVALDIVNMLGVTVRSLVSRNMEAGNYALHWDGRDDHHNPLPSGLYMYRLKAEGVLLTRKMILME